MTATHRSLVSVLAAVTALSLAACSGAADGGSSSGESSNSGTPREGGSMAFAVDSPFLGFDPNITPAAQDARVIRQVFDNLLYLDDERQLQPWLATEWEVSDDGLTYTFTLRDDVTFHDGTAFNAEAVCYNLDRIKDPETASIYAIGLIGPYESCEAPNATTAVVTMSAPYAPFLNNLTSPFLGINSPMAAEAAPPDEYTLAPIGSGPYRIESYTPNDRVVLVRNDDYDWAPGNAEHSGPAYLERMTFQIIPDATVRMGEVRTGSVNGASAIPEEEVSAVENDPNLTYIATAQSGAPYQLHLNTSRAPFDDPAVRQAARAALDIDSAIQALYMGERERAWGPLTPTTIDYAESVEGSFDYDPEAAAQLLEDAGWVEGPGGVRVKNGQRLEILYAEGAPNREKRQDLATFFEANLEAVGFDVQVEFLQPAQATTRQQNGEYDIAGLSLVAVDPNVLFQMYHPAFIPTPGQSGFNLSHTDEPAITEALTTGQQATDANVRTEAYGQVQQLVVEQARSIGIYVPTYTVVFNGVDGVRFDAEGYPIYYDAYLTE